MGWLKLVLYLSLIFILVVGAIRSAHLLPWYSEVIEHTSHRDMDSGALLYMDSPQALEANHLLILQDLGSR